MTTQRNFTGNPSWQLARETLAQLRVIPASSPEAEIEGRLYSALGFLFPDLIYPEIARQYESGDGPIDVYCRNAVFETKRPGKLDARVKPDGSTETPEEQAVRYLDALTSRPNMFDDAPEGWRACVTDGREWNFYRYNRGAPDEGKLTLLERLRLDTEADVEALLIYLHLFVNRSMKRLAPTESPEWAEQRLKPFLNLAAQYENTPEYEVKRALWRGVLHGAFINPQDDADAERDLFARHTMLVVIARAVAETLLPPEARSGHNFNERRRNIARGFAAWLIDAAGDEGGEVIADVMREVDLYEWRSYNRDTLKDLYHTVISREIRHDFGEYYTPDWLARAVCEEVMDPDWRKQIIDLAVSRRLATPAVMDPSCGSGTFLFHAVQLLLEDAREHPEIGSSEPDLVEVVNRLVGGLDLHPVAVELSKTTKMLAFGDLAETYLLVGGDDGVFLGDSLQWETRGGESAVEFGEMVDIPSEQPNNPIQMPRSLLLANRFPQLLDLVFNYANGPQQPNTENNMLELLDLPNPLDAEAALTMYRRFREYIASGRNNVWQWYIANIAQPLRLAGAPASRLVGNPPWVVYNAMEDDRQNAFRQRAQERGLWATAQLAPQNDLAATFVATCVDYYLETGGKFGFVMPYAALRTRQWAPFRAADWSLASNAERSTHVDLSADAWDMSHVQAPPFPQANSSVVFGAKVQGNRQMPNLKPLGGVHEAHGSGVNTRMPWEEVKPLLRWERRREWETAPSPEYAAAFRNGATLFPQSLVVFDRPIGRGLGRVHFTTNTAKGRWKNTDRTAHQVEERFVKQALFSRLLLPFGTLGHSHIIAPFSEDSKSVMRELPPASANTETFRIYWARADAAYASIKPPKSPAALVDRVDFYGKLSAQLNPNSELKVVYQRSGSNLAACVIPAEIVVDGTCNWFASGDEGELHYLAAIFNAPCLGTFFRIACRYSDRHFQMLPVQNLPIPAYDAGNRRHAELAALSQAAHARVAALVSERQDARLRVNRADAMNDPAMQPMLAAIDAAVRAILPAHCD